MENWSQLADQQMEKVAAAFVQRGTYIQIGAVIVIYAVAYLIANRIRKYVPVFNSDISEATDSRTRQFLGKMGGLIFPILAIFLLRVLVGILDNAVLQGGLMQAALTVAVLLLFYSVTRNFIKHKLVARVFRWVGLPLLFLHMLGVLDDLITILDAIAIQIGSIHITAYAVFRLVIFGSLLFWLGRISSKTGREFISHQEDLDERTREVVAKAFEILIFFVVFMLILKIMGINLTTLAVFGGALGVGIGLGLQAIASNFISASLS